jgi:hypothetical protein
MALRAELERALVAEMERLDDPFRFADQPAETEEVAR